MRQTLIQHLARRGFEVRRHPAARRQRVLQRLGVDLVLDVGAAKGAYAQQLRTFGYSGRIVSFEPIPSAHETLRTVSADDPLWDSYNFALGAQRGTETLNIASNSDSSSILPMLQTHRSAAPGIEYTGIHEVVVETLDHLVLEEVKASHGTFLKIDVQGFERNVLQGASEVVARLRGLQLELSFVPLYDGGMMIDEALTWAYDHNFRLVGFEQGFSSKTGEILQVDGVFKQANE